MPKNTYPNYIKGSYDRPLIIYNQQVINGGNSPYTSYTNYLNAPTIQRSVVPLARGRGGVVQSSTTNPEVISITGGISPNADFNNENFYRENRGNQQFLKEIFNQDADLIFIYTNEWQPTFLVDYTNSSSVSQDAVNLTVDNTLSSQLSKNSGVFEVDTSNDNNQVVFEATATNVVDLSSWVNSANKELSPKLGFWVYFEKSEAIKDFNKLKIKVYSSASDYIMFDTAASIIELQTIEQKNITRGWNVLTFDLFDADGNATYSTVGTFDWTTAFYSIEADIQYPDYYESSNDKIAINSAFIFNAAESRVKPDCAITQSLTLSAFEGNEFENNMISQIANSFDVELTNTQAITYNLVSNTVLSEEVKKENSVFKIDLTGQGEQFPNIFVNIPYGTQSVKLRLEGSDEELQIIKDSGTWQDFPKLSILTNQRNVLLDGSPVLFEGNFPVFKKGDQNLILETNAVGNTGTSDSGEESGYNPNWAFYEYMSCNQPQNSNQATRRIWFCNQRFTLSQDSFIKSATAKIRYVERPIYSKLDFEFDNDTPTRYGGGVTTIINTAGPEPTPEDLIIGVSFSVYGDNAGAINTPDLKYRKKLTVDEIRDVVGDYWSVSNDYVFEHSLQEILELPAGSYWFEFEFYSVIGYALGGHRFQAKEGTDVSNSYLHANVGTKSESRGGIIALLQDNLAFTLTTVNAAPDLEGGLIEVTHRPTYL